jgi:hypothetical protein
MGKLIPLAILAMVESFCFGSFLIDSMMGLLKASSYLKLGGLEVKTGSRLCYVPTQKV